MNCQNPSKTHVLTIKPNNSILITGYKDLMTVKLFDNNIRQYDYTNMIFSLKLLLENSCDSNLVTITLLNPVTRLY